MPLALNSNVFGIGSYSAYYQKRNINKKLATNYLLLIYNGFLHEENIRKMVPHSL